MNARVLRIPASSIMPAENTDVPGAAPLYPSLSSDEAFEFGALKDALPKGWVVELQPEAGMAWAAFIYQADAPRSRPMFTVCRWHDRAGMYARWMDGSASSAMAFIELWPILDLILSGIFAYTQTHLATVPTEGWANTQH